MIRVIYRDEKLWKISHAIWSIILFLINSAILWYLVVKCCFQQLIPRPPIPLSVIFLVLVLADRLHPFIHNKKVLTFRFFLDMVVWILIVLSVFAPDENVVCFLGLVVVVYLYDIVYLKDLLFDLLRRHYVLYRIYIIVKITYWILMYAHIIGCIFYAIQINLINNQVFGPFALNPTNYYQGQLLAFTPIYMFQDYNRYIYAMYYSFSLISTIAFGDIIGKNWIEDVYVTVLLVLSTVVIALILQQMYMVFKRKKARFLQLLNDIRFLSERLKGYQQISTSFRMQIINFLTEASWKKINEEPEELQTATEFKAKLMRQSVIYNDDLPLFYAKYALHKLNLAHLPKGVLVYNNLPQKQQLTSYLVTKGKFWVGYSTFQGRLAGGVTLQKPGMNFGIEEAIVGTNDLYRNLEVRTISSGAVLTISGKELRQIIEEVSDIDFPFDKPIQHFQNAKDYAIFNKNKYICSVCLTDQHTLLDCPICHYVVTDEHLNHIINRVHNRSLGKRKSTMSRKITNLHLEAMQEKSGKSWRLMEIQRYQNMFKKLKSGETQEQLLQEQWHQWAVYAANQKNVIEQEQKMKTRLTNSNISYTIRPTKYF